MNAEKGTTLGLLPSALIAAMADLASVPKTLCFHFLLRKFAVGIDFIKQQWFHANAPPHLGSKAKHPPEWLPVRSPCDQLSRRPS